MSDAKTVFSDLHEILWICPEAEALAERLVARLILKNAGVKKKSKNNVPFNLEQAQQAQLEQKSSQGVGVKSFKLQFTEILAKVSQSFVDRVTASEESDGFAAYRNAWFDIARYQTDIGDAAAMWGVDYPTLKLIVDTCEPPTSVSGRHALDVPPVVRRMRENPDCKQAVALVDPSLLIVKKTVPAKTRLIINQADKDTIPWNTKDNSKQI